MILIAVTVLIHIASHAFLGVNNYEDSLTYQSVIGRYQSIFFASVLSVLIFALAYHTIFSFRTFLLEWRHGPVWDKAVNWGAIVGAIVIVVFGMRTIVAAYFGWG